MNNFQNTTNSIGMKLIDYNFLKRYFSGIPSLKWAYTKYLQGNTVTELVYNKEFQQEHHRLIYIKGGGLRDKYPREPIKENVTPKRGSVIFKEKKYNVAKFWEQLVKNSTKLLNKGYIINLHSEIGEQSLLAGSVLASELKKEFNKESTKKLKMEQTTGAKLDYNFKDFNDYDSSVPSLAKNNVVIIYSYNTLSATDFNKAKFESFLDECFVNNTLVILTTKKEIKIKDREVINIGFSDEVKKETQLLADLFEDS